MELIDKRKAIEAMSNVTVLDKSAARRILTQLPTIEAAPVRHGKWNRVGDIDWECTACGGFSCCKGAYCPDCGAKMEGAEDDPEEN